MERIELAFLSPLLYSRNSLKNFTHRKNQRKGVHRNIKQQQQQGGPHHTTHPMPTIPSNTTQHASQYMFLLFWSRNGRLVLL